MSTNVSSPTKTGWRMSANVSSPAKTGWRMSANVSSPANFQIDHFGEYSNSPKMVNFQRVLKFDKFAGEWPLLSK